jgi:serine/threonine protein kinase
MQQAANVIVQAARGLEYAHQRGLIHRDVKPGNILVTPAGVAKVSDLGLSGFIDEAEQDPRAGRIVGTADYLSPEQIHSPSEVTSVSDIYSLGCTLYYAISGKVPFPGGTTKDKARRHLEETPWHPRRFNSECQRGVRRGHCGYDGKGALPLCRWGTTAWRRRTSIVMRTRNLDSRAVKLGLISLPAAYSPVKWLEAPDRSSCSYPMEMNNRLARTSASIGQVAS